MRGPFKGWYDAIGRRLDPQDKLLIRNSSWILSSNLFVALLAFLKSIVVARGLGPELFGTYVLMAALALTVIELLDVNAGVTVIKFGAEYHGENRLDKIVALVKCIVLTSAGLGVAAVGALALVLVLFYDALIGVPGYEALIVLYGAVAVVAYLDSLSLGLLRLFYKFKINAAVKGIAGLVDLAVSVAVLAAFPHQLKPFFIAMIATRGVSSLVLNAAATIELWPFFRPHLGAPVAVLRGAGRGILSFALSTSGSSTLNRLRNQGDKLLLGAVAGAQQVAYYEIAKKLAQSCLRLTDPLRLTIYPQLANLVAARRFDEVARLVKRVSILFAIPALLAILTGVFLGHAAVSLLYGPAFVQAVPALIVYLVIVALDLSLFWLVSLMNSVGKAKELFSVNLVTLILLVPIAFVAVQAWGALGMALAMLVTKVGSSGVLLALCRGALTRSAAPEAPGRAVSAAEKV
ncbi:MAG: oligosaccharide flippase family protein [Rubricoccaceae bacterium]|nr:oligosaccharide flippase family protein [Rubricoccaceae bacterium]